MRKHKNFISGMKLKKGALSKRATEAGMSLSAYEAKKHSSPTIRREVALAKTFAKLRKRKRR